jgi:hypothetical protein
MAMIAPSCSRRVVENIKYSKCDTYNNIRHVSPGMSKLDK